MTELTKFSNSFKDLVFLANKKAELVDKNSGLNSSPFYIGFGNPSSKLLIMGQEKSIKSDNLMQIRAESFENPKQWKYLVENEIIDVDYKFYSDFHFKNPLHPYDGKPTKGNTWLQYQKLVNFIYPNLINNKWNSFLFSSFITEINHQVSPRQLGNQKDENRESIINHNFYKSFSVTILAIGKYLNNHEIEKCFDVQFLEDHSKPRKRLLIFTNESENRIVLNVRQLSNDISIEYLKRIANSTKNTSGNIA